MKLPEKVYEILKWMVAIVIPSVCSCYCYIAGKTGLPYGELVVQIGSAACAMLGAILGISTAEFRRRNTIEIKEIKKKTNV